MSSKMPTNKWLAALVTSIGAVITALIQTGWDPTPEVQVLMVAVVVQAIVTYLAPSTPVRRKAPAR